MSPIALPVAELKPALTGLAKVLNKQSTLPVLGTIKLDRTTDGWITLTTTDLTSFATVRLEQPASGDPQTLLVPYDDLATVVKACGKDDLILIGRIDPSYTSIKYAIGGQFAEAKVESISVEDFPEIPRIRGDAIPLPESFRSSLHQALDCASTDETRYILNGACIDVSDPKCHHVVGTDGRQLYSSNSFNLSLEKSLIIRNHRFLKWKEFNQDGEWQLKMAPGQKKDEPDRIQISTRRWRFISEEIDGVYPNWRQVVPGAGETKVRVELDPASLDQVVQTIQRMPCHETVNLTIGLEVADGKLRLVGRSPTAEAWTKVEIPFTKIIGKPIQLFLNRDYLIKALKFGLTTVEMNDPLSPLIFSAGGRKMVIMPLRTGAEPATGHTVAEVKQPAAPEENGTGAAEPVNSAAEQPSTSAATSNAASTTEKNEMASQTTSPDTSDGSTPTPQSTASKIDEALELVDSLKESLQQGVSSLKDVSSKLKLMQKEQKSAEREYQSIRSTLRSLQSVKL